MADGNVVLSDIQSKKIMQLDSDHQVHTLAGTGEQEQKFGPAARASLGQPAAMTAEENSLFVCDPSTSSILHCQQDLWCSGFSSYFRVLFDPCTICTSKNVTLEGSIFKMQTISHFEQLEEKVRTTFGVKDTIQRTPGICTTSVCRQNNFFY